METILICSVSCLPSLGIKTSCSRLNPSADRGRALADNVSSPSARRAGRGRLETTNHRLCLTYKRETRALCFVGRKATWRLGLGATGSRICDGAVEPLTSYGLTALACRPPLQTATCRQPRATGLYRPPGRGPEVQVAVPQAGPLRGLRAAVLSRPPSQLLVATGSRGRPWLGGGIAPSLPPSSHDRLPPCVCLKPPFVFQGHRHGTWGQPKSKAIPS